MSHYPIEYLPLDSLTPDPDNAMAHSDAEMQRLVGSVSEYGFLEPVVWNKTTGHIVGGHARVEAARASGMTTVPVVVVEMDDTREAAANLALNGSYGTWDDERLTAVLQELQAADYDLDLTGIEPFKISELIGGVPDFQPVDESAMARLDQKAEVECPSCGERFHPL